jgi:hypothetical protein
MSWARFERIMVRDAGLSLIVVEAAKDIGRDGGRRESRSATGGQFLRVPRSDQITGGILAFLYRWPAPPVRSARHKNDPRLFFA